MGWMMSRMVLVLVGAMVAAGCQQSPPKSASGAAAHPSVLDVSTPAAAGYQPSASSPSSKAYVPPPGLPAPIPPAAPPPETNALPAVTQTPAAAQAASSSTAAAGASYTVKKGDTLYHIAKEHYGDGKRWQQIAAANPGIAPNSLRVGQTLVMP